MKLKVEHASFAYPNGRSIFKDLDLELDTGEIMAVLGPNGAGKTTLLRCIMGMLKWTRGRAYLDGDDTSQMSARSFWSRVSYVPQQRNAASPYTALESVLIGRSGEMGFFSSPSAQDREAAERVMEELGILKFRDRLCDTLSGGELQMVLIARAVVSEPRLLIMDEPESGLDFRNQLIVLDAMESLSRRGISCIFNTHYPKHALQRADRSLLLGDGEHYFGKTDDIVTEETVERIFGVKALIHEIQVGDEKIRNLIPLYVSKKESI